MLAGRSRTSCGFLFLDGSGLLTTVFIWFGEEQLGKGQNCHSFFKANLDPNFKAKVMWEAKEFLKQICDPSYESVRGKNVVLTSIDPEATEGLGSHHS